MPKSDKSDGDAFAGIRFEHNCQRAQDACGMTDCGQCGAAGDQAKLEQATFAVKRPFAGVDQEGDDPRLASNNGLQQEATIPRTHVVPRDDVDAYKEVVTRVAVVQMG